MSRAMRLKGIRCESGTVPAAVSPNYYRCTKPLVVPTTEKEQRDRDKSEYLFTNQESYRGFRLEQQ